jgi:NAD(P)-dependent dehydrogenase (short-subunit alcohol dehydrogenase family)
MTGWTTADIPDLTDRTAVVTGANSGLGYVTARELARKGARVVLACRSEARGSGAVERIGREVPGARVELRLLDLGDLASVRGFARALPYDRLDLLVNNAGVMALPYGTTADGFETQFGVNHLGHFALTALLLSRLRAAEDAPWTVDDAMARRLWRESARLTGVTCGALGGDT